jgi:hypothetical protein
MKDAARFEDEGKIKTKDIEARVEQYSHEKAPFGNACLNVEFETPANFGGISVRAKMSLAEIGANAKSELPDQN